jgi:hypothetical protein
VVGVITTPAAGLLLVETAQMPGSISEVAKNGAGEMALGHCGCECEACESCSNEMEKAAGPKRSELPDSDFAVIRTVDDKKLRQLRIDDESHARNALARMNQVLPKLSSSQTSAVRRKIKGRYPKIEVTGVEKIDWKTAIPRPLYVRRNLLNAGEFIKWAKSQGFKSTLPAEEMHVTLVYSKTAVDWEQFTERTDIVGLYAVTEKRKLTPLGKDGAIVLQFQSSELSVRHEEFGRGGASWDYPSFHPHVTVSYNAEGLDLSTIPPYAGYLEFGPEIFDEIDDTWKMRAVEKFELANLQSIEVSKSEFKGRDAAVAWAKSQKLDTQRLVDLHDVWIFIQKDHEGGRLKERVLDTGLVAKFELREAVNKIIPFAKVNAEERTVEGVVYEPYVPDSQGDWMTPEDIQKAAWGFLEKMRQRQVDTDHDEVAKDCSLVESFIAPPNHPLYPVGAWVAKTKINADAVWDRVLKGDLNGYSMAGQGERLVGASPPNGLFTKADQPATVEDVLISKAATMQRTHGRLRKVDVLFLSLVKRGANGHDFMFKKTDEADQVTIFKSRDLQLASGECQIQFDGPLTRFWKSLKSTFGSNSQETPGSVDAPDTHGKVDAVSIGKQFAGLVAMIAKQSADAQQIILEMAKTPAVGQVVKQTPAFQTFLSKVNPAEVAKLSKFAQDVGSLTQLPDNGVILPAAQDFFGFVQALDDPTKWMGGSLPGGADGASGSMGGFGKGGLPPWLEGKDKEKDKEKDVKKDETPAPANPMAGYEAALQKALGVVVEKFTAELAGVKAELATVAKAAGQPTPPPAGGLSAQGVTPAPATPPGPGAFAIFQDSDAEEMVKTDIAKGYSTPMNPFGGVADASGILTGPRDPKPQATGYNPGLHFDQVLTARQQRGGR